MDTIEEYSHDDSDYKSTRFRTSVRMSTYLVAFLVSDFGYTNNSKDASESNFLIVQANLSISSKDVP